MRTARLASSKTTKRPVKKSAKMPNIAQEAHQNTKKGLISV